MRGVERPAAALVALGLIAWGDAAQAQTPAKAELPSITVQGEAAREVAPDMAVITLGVTTDRPSASEAGSQNSRTASGLIDEVKTAGVADADIQTTQVALTPVFETGRQGSDTPKLKGFRASNMIDVRVRTLSAVGPLLGRLVDKGANTVQGVDFLLANPAPVMDALRGDATRDARRKAQIYADAAGVRLGRVLDIAPESATAMPALRRMKSASILAAAPAPETPLQAGMQTLEAHVGVTWELLQ